MLLAFNSTCCSLSIFLFLSLNIFWYRVFSEHPMSLSFMFIFHSCHFSLQTYSLMHITKYGMSLLSCLWARQLYRTHSLHPPGHTLTVGVFRDAIKGTRCVTYTKSLSKCKKTFYAQWSLPEQTFVAYSYRKIHESCRISQKLKTGCAFPRSYIQECIYMCIYTYIHTYIHTHKILKWRIICFALWC